MTDRTEEFQPAGPPSADAPPQAQATTHDADVPPQAQTQTHGADAPPQMQTQTHGAGTQSPLPNRSRRRIMAALHQGSVVFFGVFGAFFLSIYLGLWVSLGVSLLIDSAPLWFLKFIAVPLALDIQQAVAEVDGVSSQNVTVEDYLQAERLTDLLRQERERRRHMRAT